MKVLISEFDKKGQPAGDALVEAASAAAAYEAWLERQFEASPRATFSGGGPHAGLSFSVFRDRRAYRVGRATVQQRRNVK